MKARASLLGLTILIMSLPVEALTLAETLNSRRVYYQNALERRREHIQRIDGMLDELARIENKTRLVVRNGDGDRVVVSSAAEVYTLPHSLALRERSEINARLTEHLAGLQAQRIPLADGTFTDQASVNRQRYFAALANLTKMDERTLRAERFDPAVLRDLELVRTLIPLSVDERLARLKMLEGSEFGRPYRGEKFDSTQKPAAVVTLETEEQERKILVTRGQALKITTITDEVVQCDVKAVEENGDVVCQKHYPPELVKIYPELEKDVKVINLNRAKSVEVYRDLAAMASGSLLLAVVVRGGIERINQHVSGLKKNSMTKVTAPQAPSQVGRGEVRAPYTPNPGAMNLANDARMGLSGFLTPTAASTAF